LNVALRAKKNRGARLRRGGFPYNLMKSLESVVNGVPLLCQSPPFSFINDTKVQDIAPMIKDKKMHLLSRKLKPIFG